MMTSLPDVSLSTLHRVRHLIVASLTALAVSTVFAQTATAPSTAGPATSKLVTSYAEWAGSTTNATSLVKGLRTGSKITLTEPAPTPGAPDAMVSFIAPTKPMGYGNIRIALALAQTQLASQGIKDPTPLELQQALMGTVAPDGTATQGILQMRASGMGWGAIANSMGFKLGEVMRATPNKAATDKALAKSSKADKAIKTSASSKSYVGSSRSQSHGGGNSSNKGGNSGSSGGSSSSSGGGGGGKGGK